MSTAAIVLEKGRHWWHEFRARSVYFQLKALVIVLYAASVAVTLLWLSRPVGGARNDLDARVVVFPGDPFMGRYFVVQNEGDEDWVGIRFVVDGGYMTKREAMLKGEKVTLLLRDFSRTVTTSGKPRVERAPPNHPVTKLRIETRAGSVVYPLPSGGR